MPSASLFVPPQAPAPTARRRLPTLLLGGAGILFGSSFGYLIGKVVKGTSAANAVGLGLLLWLPVAWLVAVAIHEAGHLYFGARVGLRPLLYVVGPLRAAREGARFKFSFNTSLATWGGLSAAVPSTTERLPERMMWLVAGGPMASLTLAVICLGGGAILGGGAGGPLLITGAISTFICLATLIPVSLGGFMSDGAQLLSLRRGGEDVERRTLLIALAGASMAGVRPRDLDRELVERATALGGTASGRAAALMIATSVALDRGDSSEALFAELGTLFYEFPGGFRQGLALWMAWYVATVVRDGKAASTWLDLGRGGMVDPALRDLAEAAVAGLAGRVDEARAAVERGRRRGPGMDPGGAFLIQDLLTSQSLSLES